MGRRILERESSRLETPNGGNWATVRIVGDAPCPRRHACLAFARPIAVRTNPILALSRTP